MRKQRFARSLLALGLLGASASQAAVLTFTDSSAFAAAAGALTVENFDAAPWVTGANPQPTTNLGVSWTSTEDLFGSTAASRSGTRSLSPVDTGGLTDQLDATLPGGIRAIGVWLTTFGQSHGVTLSVSGSGGLLGDINSGATAGFDFGQFIGIITDQDITSLRLISTVSGAADDFAIDDFSFGAGPRRVPEPGSLALLGLGLAGLAALRRRPA